MDESGSPTRAQRTLNFEGEPHSPIVAQKCVSLVGECLWHTGPQSLSVLCLSTAPHLVLFLLLTLFNLEHD